MGGDAPTVDSEDGADTVALLQTALHLNANGPPAALLQAPLRLDAGASPERAPPPPAEAPPCAPPPGRWSEAEGLLMLSLMTGGYRAPTSHIAVSLLASQPRQRSSVESVLRHVAGAAEPWIAKTFYHQALIPLVLVTLLLAWQARPSTTEEIPAGFLKFQLSYLSVWVFSVGADWLQGAYVYALYEDYGYPREQIAQLFVAGFMSSLVFSCFVGAVCDRYGRKRCALAYCLLYTVSCLTKHVRHYWVLMLGRVTGGIATSLLFSGFECWLVSEHRGRHGFSEGLLSHMFGLMYMSSYFVAILSGIVGELLDSGFAFRPVEPGSIIYRGGALGPFDASIVCLLVAGVLILAFWRENYGEDAHGVTASGQHGRCERPSTRDLLQQHQPHSLGANLLEATQLLVSDRRMCLVGVASACFEGAMYAFVFNWSPALDSEEVPPPYGLIFSLFMMACMCGASLATLAERGTTPGWRLILAFAVSAASFVVAAAVDGVGDIRVSFAALCAIELCVGAYFPSMSVLKSDVVPERIRATMYNLYRVPLNAVVVLLLLTNMGIAQVFDCCAGLLGVAFLSAGSIVAYVPALPKSEAKL